jgi:hypothetical protein
LGVRVPPSALVETATNKALTSNLLVGALFVEEDQLPSPPGIRGSTAAKYRSRVLASRAALVGRHALVVNVGRSSATDWRNDRD